MLRNPAIVLCAIFIAYLFWTDLKRQDAPSVAIWVPTIWLFLAATRFASAWLGMPPDAGAGESPLDRAVFSGLILFGLLILARRKIEWGSWLARNPWFCLYVLYCLASAGWADDPGTVLKRWVKELGNPIMALVVLTERRPYEAVQVMLRRLAFVALPLSVVFIRYIPHLGVQYHFDGSPMYSGVGYGKNALGAICLITGLHLIGECLKKPRPFLTAPGLPSFAREHRIVFLILAGMAAWLLSVSGSKTPLVCLFAGALILLLCRLPLMTQQPALLIGTLVAATLLILIAEQLFQVSALVISLLGRRPDLTNRTDIWSITASFAGNPFLGVGFMSFWSGERLVALTRQIGGEINQAHNGYLEQYLNLGYVGVAFILIIVGGALLKIPNHMKKDSDAAAMRLAVIVSALLYNYAEASFYGANPVWILLLLACLDRPELHNQSVEACPAIKPGVAPLMYGIQPQQQSVRTMKREDHSPVLLRQSPAKQGAMSSLSPRRRPRRST